MCSLLNYGFVSVVDTCVFCIVFVLFYKTVVLYCYANKSLESICVNGRMAVAKNVVNGTNKK